MQPIINRTQEHAARTYRPYWARQNGYEAALPELLVSSKSILPADDPEVTGPTWQTPALVLLGAALAVLAVAVGQLI